MRAACTHPFIHLGQLEFPKSSYTVRRQAFTLPPAINGVLGDAQVLGDLTNGYPRLISHGDCA